MTLRPLTWQPRKPRAGTSHPRYPGSTSLAADGRKKTSKLLVDYSSSDSVPELVDSDSEVCSGEAPPKCLNLPKPP